MIDSDIGINILEITCTVFGFIYKKLVLIFEGGLLVLVDFRVPRSSSL